MNPTIRAAIEATARLARQHGLSSIGPEQLLLGALAQSLDPAVELVAAHGLTQEAVARTYQRMVGHSFGQPIEASGDMAWLITPEAAEVQAAVLPQGDHPQALGYFLLALVERDTIARRLVRETLGDVNDRSIATETLAQALRASLAS
jgi:hypothetical protein